MGRNRSSSRSSSSSRSRSRSMSPSDGFRVHIGDLGVDITKRDLEKQFGKYGSLLEVWMAKNPPCFAFIVFRHKEDAEQAVRSMNGVDFYGHRLRVSMALPRSRGRRRTGFDPNLRCYSCGERGHFSRDCNGIFRFRNKLRGDSPRFRSSPSRSSRNYRSRSRDRSPASQQRGRSNTRPHTTKRRGRSRSSSNESLKRYKSARSRSNERGQRRRTSSQHDRSLSRGRDQRK